MIITTTPAEYDVDLKLVLVGDCNVGKSSLVSSYTSNTFKPLPATIGVDKKLLYVTTGEKKLRLSIWDTAGQETFRSIVGSYYRNTHGFIMVYDITNRSSFTNLSNYWINEINNYSTKENSVKMIVGNKADEEMKRVVTSSEGKRLAEENGCLFCECSAMYRVNVEKSVRKLVSKILQTTADEELSQLCIYGSHLNPLNNTNGYPPPSGKKCKC